MTINTTGYTLVFDPSFSSLSLESSSNPSGTWDTAYPWAVWNTPGSADSNGRTLDSNNEAEFYSDPTVGVNPFSVNNGVLTITAAPATSAMLAAEAAANNGATLPYTSGILTTNTSFAQTYGLYEITAKLPAGQGLWPAIWMLPTSGAWPPELDILETIGSQPTGDNMTIHTGTNNTQLQTTVQVPTAVTAFNTYAVDWEPTTITYYIDGKQVFQEATPADMHQPMYMLINLAVGGAGSWPGAPNSSTVFPAQMQISSVQVYASPNTIADYNNTGVQTTTTPLPPVAETDIFTGQENKVITGNLLANNGNGAATDPNGLALSVVAATLTTTHGATVVENANGTFTYTPATGFFGKDSFTYTVQDSAGLTSTATANITVYAPPVAQPDNFTGTENKVITGNMLTNDTDPNGLALSVTAATITTAHGATVVENANGTFTYTPATGFFGKDSFTYTVQDSAGLTSTATANITVNAPPVAQPDNFTGTENKVITGNMLTNDTDPNGLALSVTAATITTAHGATVVENANGTFTYTPATGFFGKDSFTYTVQDSAGLTSTATANITVYAPPVAETDIFTDQENKAITGNLLANNGNGAATDPNGLALNVVAATLTTAHGGSVVENANGTFTYTPATGFFGNDSFTYTVADSAGLTSTATANITVYAPPVAEPDSFTGQENKPVTGNLMANNGNGAASDPNGLALNVVAATLTTAHGATVVENADGTFTYTPATGFFGGDSFTYTVADSAGLTSIATANITVNAPSDIITGGSGNATLSDGGAGAGNYTLIGNSTNGGDMFIVNNAGDLVTEANGGGAALVVSSVNWTLSANTNQLTLTGSANLTGTANAGHDIITSNSGVDTLIGGSGADTFVVNNAQDVITETNGGSNTYILNSNHDTRMMSGYQDAAIANGNGDAITLNGWADTVTLAGGGDTVNFSGGSNSGAEDIIDMGTGSDTFNIETNYGAGNIAGSNSAINIDGYQDNVTVTGNNEAIELSGQSDKVTISGTGDIVTLKGIVENVTDTGNNDTFNITNSYSTGSIAGSNNTVNISGYQDNLSVASGDTVAVTGYQAVLGVTGGSDTVILNAVSETITDTGTGHDIITMTSTYDGGTIAGSGSVITMTGYGDNVTASGNNDTISMSTWGDTVTLKGGSDTVDFTKDGSNVTDTGTGNDTFNIASDYGTGTIAGSNSAINIDGYQDSVTVTGNSEAIELSGQGDKVTVGGTGDIVTLKGIVENVTDTGSNDTFNITNSYSTGSIAGSNNAVNISGYQDHLTVASGDTVTMTGWQDSLSITGSGDTVNLSAISGAGAENIADTGTGNDTFNIASGSATGTIAGSNSVINMSGYLDNLTVSGSSETVNLSNWNETLTLSGNNEALNIKGAGADTFVLTGAATYNSHDVLAGFSAAEGDVLNISNIVSGYTSGASTLANFVEAVSNGSGGTLLQVDSTGSGSHFQTVVTLTGVSSVDIATYIAHGNLIV